MLDINEFRGGNLIWDDYSGIMEVTLIDIENETLNLKKVGFIVSGKYLLKDLKGLSITKELISRTNLFQAINGKDKWFFSYNGRFHYLEKVGDEFRYNMGYENDGFVQYKFKYFHELQNIVYYLTKNKI
jgi:hypothetical protein